MSKIKIASLFITLCLTRLCLYAGEIDITVGSGYDYISSNYYLLTEDTLAISPDSLESLKRSGEASNEFMLIGKLRYDQALSKIIRLELSNKSHISDKSFKENFDAGLHIGDFAVENHLDIRNRDKLEDDDLNQDYISNLTRASFRTHLGHEFHLRIINAYEFIRYDNPEGYLYDYNYNKLNLELEKDFGFEGLISMGYRNDIKKVSDSTRLEYNRHAVLFSCEYSPSWSFGIRLNNDFSIKDSKKENQLDDEKLENLELTINYDPTFSLGFRFYNQLEYTFYDIQDLAFFDQLYYRSKLKVMRTFGQKLELSITPHFRLLSAREKMYQEQDFREYSVEPGIGYNAGMDFWLDISYEIGRRIYPHRSEGFFTDHTLHRFNLFLDARIIGSLNFSLMASIDWENHEQTEDNSRLYLISAGFEYGF